jgi:hypothetical protein
VDLYVILLTDAYSFSPNAFPVPLFHVQNVDGGKIIFEFTTEAQYVNEMGFVDVDYATKMKVYHRTNEGIVETVINLTLLGDNSGERSA